QDIPFSSDLHKVPLMARVGRSGVGVDIVARNPDTVAQRLHSSGKAGTLRFPVHEGAPGCVCAVVLPSSPGIPAVGADEVKGGKYLFVIAHFLADVIIFKALHDTAYFQKFGSTERRPVHASRRSEERS